MLPDQVRFEALKLLATAARADREIDARERDYLLSVAQELGMPNSQIEEIRTLMADEWRLTGANLSRLREHRDPLLRAVDELIAIDDRIVDDERAVREAIVKILDET